ncbi:Ribonuclease D [Planctomycetaceae bacterium]|nr:Ribonuclease D [Planctomycetaceae bacterium]
MVTTQAQLKSALAELEQAVRVSLDIESDSFYHYDDRVCIVTISRPGKNFIIDTLALGEDARLLQSLVARKDRPLLMHSANNDVLALKKAYRFEFGMIQDTALACTLLNYPQTSLAHLAESFLGLRLPKDLQRHDWGQRPIEATHAEYLINDTRHLFEIHDKLTAELQHHGIYEEYELECRALVQGEPNKREFDPERFRRIKGHEDLDASRRGALKSLYAWRDSVARALNRAPFRVVSDSTLLDLARTPPLAGEDLAKRSGVGRWLVAEHDAAIRAAITRGLTEPAPPRAPFKPKEGDDTRRLDPRQRDILGKLKGWREKEAAARGLGMQTILPTPVMHELLQQPPTSIEDLARHPRVGKNRATRYGEALLKMLAPLVKRR